MPSWHGAQLNHTNNFTFYLTDFGTALDRNETPFANDVTVLTK